MAIKRKLPPGYVLLSHEEFVPITPDDKIPPHYFSGPDMPELTPAQLPSDDKTYWHDFNDNKVKVATVVGNRIDWIPCEQVKLVTDLTHTPIVAIGKIIAVRPPDDNASAKEDKTSFSDVLSMAKKRVESRGK